MKLPLLPAAFVAVFALVFTPARGGDLEALQGKWKVESAEAGGGPVQSEGLMRVEVTIMGDRYTLLTDDGPDGGTLKLDETQTPKTMDAVDTEGLDVGKTIRAIYEVKGDILRICYALDGSARPTEFATRQGAPWLLVTYRRQP